MIAIVLVGLVLAVGGILAVALIGQLRVSPPAEIRRSAVIDDDVP